MHMAKKVDGWSSTTTGKSRKKPMASEENPHARDTAAFVAFPTSEASRRSKKIPGNSVTP